MQYPSSFQLKAYMAAQASLLSSSFIVPSSPPSNLQEFQVARKRNHKVRCNYVTPNSNSKNDHGGGGGGGDSKTNLRWIVHLPQEEIEKKTATKFEGDERTQQLTLPLVNWHLHLHHPQVDDKLRFSTQVETSVEDEEITKRVRGIKGMLAKMKDGEITVSAYDTAWVALVEAEVDDNNNNNKKKKKKKKRRTPMFPECLEWIQANQLDDGSWGDPVLFLAHDRILNTLACVVALSFWSLHPRSCELGMEFIHKNLEKLREEKEEHMPIAFELAFPSLIQMAQSLGIHLHHHSELLQHIYSKRDLKLSRIPSEMVHNKATTLLHSLEGMGGLNWEKLMKLQSQDGSFLFSPSSTAFALMNTNDSNCFSYLQATLCKFNGGVPNVYPVDLFEHIWVVDRLQRLGISRFFRSEIKVCLDYVYKYWSSKGICWASNSEVQDIDDTSMGFRLLRLEGYHVSADVFKKFEKEGEFMCFAGQRSSSQAVTGMFNLYRASQLQYPGETILDDARSFSSNYLTQKQASNQLFDKWIIQKDLPGEVGYALDLPWFASLPRIEARFYIDQYGGEDDVWIGKTLYRMPYVSNNSYLELAKLDFNACQKLHLLEWEAVKRWHVNYGLDKFGLTQRELLQIYFVAASSIFEPERSNERLAWSKTTAMVAAISGYFSRQSKATLNQRREFAEDFLKSYSTYRFSSNFFCSDRKEQGLMGSLLSTLNGLYFDVLMTKGVDIRPTLHKAWGKWMLTWAKEGDRYKGEAELVARTIQACSNLCCLEAIEEHSFCYNLLIETTNEICHKLGQFSNPREMDVQDEKENGDVLKQVFCEVNSDMQRLLQLVLPDFSGIDHEIRHSFLVVARAYYYLAYSSHSNLSSHIQKVLFQRVQ